MSITLYLNFDLKDYRQRCQMAIIDGFVVFYYINSELNLQILILLLLN